MPLKDILLQLGSEVGALNYGEDTDTRALLLTRINRAAREIYETTDLPGVLREIYVRATANKIIALPQFVGAVRAIRQSNIGRPWALNDMRPRYHVKSWKNGYKTWRQIGVGAIEVDITNAAPVTVAIAVADSDLTVTIVGSTADTNKAIDTFVMSSTTVVGTKNFTNIDSIQLSKQSDYDIEVTDANDNHLATVYNNTRESQYLLYDVSDIPRTLETDTDSGETFIMEVLYKMKLPVLNNDEDVFPIPGYDDIIASKALQLFLEQQEGKEDRAILIDKKVERSMMKRNQDQEGPNVRRINFKENPLYGMFRSKAYRASKRFGKGVI